MPILTARTPHPATLLPHQPRKVQDPLPGNHTGRLQASPPKPDILGSWGLRAVRIRLPMGSSPPTARPPELLQSSRSPLPLAGAPQAPWAPFLGSSRTSAEILLKMFFLCFVLFRNFPNFYQVKDTTTRMCSLAGRVRKQPLPHRQPPPKPPPPTQQQRVPDVYKKTNSVQTEHLGKVHRYTCAHRHTRTHKPAQTHKRKCAHAHIKKHVYTRAHSYTYTETHEHTCTQQTLPCVHIQTHTHVSTHTRTATLPCVHIQTHM